MIDLTLANEKTDKFEGEYNYYSSPKISAIVDRETK